MEEGAWTDFWIYEDLCMCASVYNVYVCASVIWIEDQFI